ncbi:MAG TPA: hypothetical protein DCQ77_10890 [Betaproteobacteria bacterium]|nr:hypothetical protein [Betaproteobacteria bacterium]
MGSRSIIAAKDSCRAAQAFNLFSISVVLIAPLLLLGIAVSIFVYASVAHHPNAKVVKYNQWAGYRFYGAAGSMMILGSPIYHIFGNWHGLLAIWVIMFIVVIPWGIWSIVKAQRAKWSEIQVGTALSVA